jgi:sec-independent protein translocase protein TatC
VKQLGAGGEADADAKPFMEHLEDLRGMLIKCGVALAIGTGVAVPFAPIIFAWLTRPLESAIGRTGAQLQSIEVTGAFSVAMRIGLWGGLLLSAPFLVFFIGQFIFPGLTEREQRLIRTAGAFSVLLFVGGVLLGYFGTLPVALKMMFGLHTWLGIESAPQASSYIAFTVHLLLAFGVAFQMPVILVALGRMGFLTSRQLRERRNIVWVILLIVAMILTPPDVFTQMMMAGPLILLYEMCIWIVYATDKKEPEAGANI